MLLRKLCEYCTVHFIGSGQEYNILGTNYMHANGTWKANCSMERPGLHCVKEILAGMDSRWPSL